MKTVKVDAQFPEKAMPIFTPAPWKIIYGGRGKGASWTFARAALILGTHKKLFIVCAREVQQSIKDSVHKLLSDQIEQLGYGARKGPTPGEDIPAFYEVLDTEIRGRNGTTFVFVGLNNINSIKSTEGIDILWVTEAVHVPRSKWLVLGPTVRRDPPFGPFRQGSEIWIDFNPELSSDDTYKMFVVKPPADAIVIEMSYQDNPFFPQVLRKQMLDMRNDNYDDYLNIWEGKTKRVLDGAIFANEIRMATQDNRIGPHVRLDPKRPVIASFDLGDQDVTAMWVWQQVGNEHNAVGYHEESGQDIVYFLQMLQEKRLMVRGVWLPHDARQQHQAARRLVQNTIEKQAKAFYPTPGVVKVIPNTSLTIQINAARALFPRVLINDAECSRGMMCLQHYQFGIHRNTKERSAQPLHNWASHGASGFMQYCVWLREGIKRERENDTGEELPDIERDAPGPGNSHSQSWMA